MSQIRSTLFMDSDESYLGNSPGDDSRGRLHVVIKNKDGEAIPVVQVNASPLDDLSVFNSVSAVPADTETVIAQVLVPEGRPFSLTRVEVSGENIASFTVTCNGEAIAKKRTHFGGGLSANFEFAHSREFGPVFAPGSLIQVKVIHSRPFVAGFEARIQGLVERI